MWSTRLHQWAVVPGARTVTDFHEAAKQLGWPPQDIVVGGHSHAVDAETGLTPDRNVLASGRGGDVSGIKEDSAHGAPERAKRIEAIWVVVERPAPNGQGTVKVRDRTWVIYDPKHGWTIDFPLPGPKPGRDRVSFVDIDQYHRWFRKRFGSDPGVALPVGRGRASNDAKANDPSLADSAVPKNLARLAKAWEEAPRGILWGDQAEQAAQLKSTDPAVRKKAVDELAALEGAMLYATGRGDPGDYDQPPEIGRPSDWVDFTSDNARNAILEDRRSNRLKQLNDGELADLPDDAFTVSEKMQNINSDVEFEDRKVVTIVVTLPNGTKKEFRFSVAWNSQTGRFADIHESSGQRGRR